MDRGADEEDGQVTWDTPVFPWQHTGQVYGGPKTNSPTRRAVADARTGRLRRSVRVVAGRAQGEPERRPKGMGESEGRIVALTPGKRGRARPDRAKAARVGTSFGRETWTAH